MGARVEWIAFLSYLGAGIAALVDKWLPGLVVYPLELLVLLIEEPTGLKTCLV